MAPVPGVVYTMDRASGLWVAPGRESLPGVVDPSSVVWLAGADPLGSAVYEVPEDAVVVALDGSDAAVGSEVAPKASLAAAIAAAQAGGTVVLRGGTYRQAVPGNVSKALTVQAWPGEVVWLDGSDVVTGWVAAGGRWVRSGWTAQFDHSASYTYGSNAGNFVNASRPLAAWPDQVWIDDVRQEIVAADPGPGQFAVDYAAGTLTLGSDPTGKQVTATVRATCLVLAAPVTLRGLGVRRYGTPLPALGMVNIVSAGAGSRVEQCHFQDCATQLLSVGGGTDAARTVVTRNTFRGGGMTGVHSNNSAGCVFDFTQNVVDDTNWRGFNVQPASAALRTSRSLRAYVAHNVITATAGVGVWFDVFSRECVVVNNLVDGVADMGVCFEISQGCMIVGNRIRNSARQGLLVLASADVEAWNNEVERSTQFDLAFKDDARGPDSEFGVEVYVRRSAIKNNVISNPNAESTTGWRVVVYDSALVLPADGMVQVDGIGGNVWTADQAPSGASSCSRMLGGGVGGGVGTVTSYSTPSAFAAAKPVPAASPVGVLSSALAPGSSMLADLAPGVAVPLSAEVAAALGAPLWAGRRVLGAPLPAPVPVN